MAIWCCFSKEGAIHFGVVEGDQVTAIAGTPWGDHHRTGPSIPLKHVKLEVPVIPSVFYCVGINYADHIRRMAQTRGTEPVFPKQT